MYCPECGIMLDGKHKFCPVCGTRVCAVRPKKQPSPVPLLLCPRKGTAEGWESDFLKTVGTIAGVLVGILTVVVTLFLVFWTLSSLNTMEPSPVGNVAESSEVMIIQAYTEGFS